MTEGFAVKTGWMLARQIFCKYHGNQYIAGGYINLLQINKCLAGAGI